MAIRLATDPIINITLNNGELFSDYAPDFMFENFTLTKKLLEPNCFEFRVRKRKFSVEYSDIEFELKDLLLGAKVECSVTGRRYDEEEGGMVSDEVGDFFYGFIQNIKILREKADSPVTFKCIAYSPDARLKLFPSCRTFNEYKLEDCVAEVISTNAGEESTDLQDGEYPDAHGLGYDVNPRYTMEMPYTVQYNESAYEFLKRLAKRYGEFFYYEDGEVIFGDMKEKELIAMTLGGDLEEYDYDLNMNHHTGIMFAQHNRPTDVDFASGMEKYPQGNTGDELRESAADPQNDMARAPYAMSNRFFNGSYNSVYELGNTPVVDKVLSILKPAMPADYHKKVEATAFSDESISKYYSNVQKDLNGQRAFAEKNNFEEKTWTHMQRDLLDLYVAADSMICHGKAQRADLKLGTVISILDKTRTGASMEDWFEHDPLKVVEISYIWKQEDSRSMTNEFKAIAKESLVPPYLERDEHGFLVYGDFDAYPKSGPQHGIVISNKDPENMGRVKVSLLWQDALGRTLEGEEYLRYLDKHQSTPWIWVSTQYMGYYHGTHLIPELGDQVMVGFEHNNAERPYVMGSLVSEYGFSSLVDNMTFKDDDLITSNNNVKLFKTRSGHTIAFYDDYRDGFEKCGCMEIADANGLTYSIYMSIDDKKIRIKAKGNVEILADNNIVLKAGNNIIMDAKNNIEMTAQNDIYRTADHNITDTEGNDYINSVGNDFNTYINDSDTHMHMIKDRIQMELDGGEQILKMQKDAGIGIIDKGANSKAVVSSDNETQVVGKMKVNIESDMEIDEKAKQVNVNGDVDVNIKGGMVKIN